MNKIILSSVIVVLIFSILCISSITASTDSYNLKWNYDTGPHAPSSVSHISPSTNNQVPYIQLGRYLNFKYLEVLYKSVLTII